MWNFNYFEFYRIDTWFIFILTAININPCYFITFFFSAENSFKNSMLKKLVSRIKKVEQHPRGSNFFPQESGLLSVAIFPQNIFRIKFLSRFAFQLNTVMSSQQSDRCLKLLLVLLLLLSLSLLIWIFLLLLMLKVTTARF